MVARAWTDPEYRRLLLTDGTAAAERMGVSMAGAPPLGVLEDTPALHHVIVCTLCSCYPRAVLGYPPHWYKSFAYRARVVREPRAVLAEWGTVLPPGVEVRVVDSTADYRWMVLPMRPAGTEGWSEEQLMALVTRDVLVGVALPVLPVAAAAAE
jgi:nitrile hydratase